MGVLVLLHRWLGLASCLLFAMWFATGIVMHFVPFPSLTEAERFSGLAPVESWRVAIDPPEAVRASGIEDAQRVRLIQRSYGPVYVISGQSRLRAVRASDATNAAIKSPDIAQAAATDHAHRRGLDMSSPSVLALADYDQWTVPNGFDRDRPLFRVALGDAAGTDLYVSSATGEIVLDTTRSERFWNFVGSVPHWIYPTVLRSNWSLWDKVVWTLSLLAMIAAALGAVLGIARIKVWDGRVTSPYRGWHAVHHIIGLMSMIFVLTWIFSGWLSMDHGRLFSRGQLPKAEADMAAPAPDWRTLPIIRWEPISPSTREVEWFWFNGAFYRRDRIGVDRQVLFRAGGVEIGDQSGSLGPRDVQGFSARLAADCAAPLALAANEDYPALSTMPGAPVYRSKCGDVWFDIDGANGNVLQRWDSSRRAYRWLYSGLHTFDVPVLLIHPGIRSVLIVSLCVLGLLFSLTGIVIGQRRLASDIRKQGSSVAGARK
jgi:PepSY-associated TM region